MNLADLQRAFIEHITGGNTEIEQWISAGQGMDAKERLAVYSNNMRLSLRHALQQIYPVCFRILGKDYFSQVSHLYNQRYPSQLADLNHHGEYLAQLFEELATTRPELKDYPYLADLARLEYHYHRVYYAEDALAFDYQAFAECAADHAQSLSFCLPQSSSLLASDYPLLEIWQANQDEGGQADTVYSDGQGQHLWIWRKEGKPHITKLEQKTYSLLESIDQGWTLVKLADAYPDLDDLLPQLIQQGWIESFAMQQT